MSVGKHAVGRRPLGKLALLLALAMVVSAFAVGPLAGADVDRNPARTIDFVGTYLGTYEHHYSITVECGEVSGVGEWRSDWAKTREENGPGGWTLETLTNVVVDGTNVSFYLTYEGPYNPGYTYTFAEADVESSLIQNGWAFTEYSSAEYRNHGAWVKASANKKEAAQYCAGMPTVSG